MLKNSCIKKILIFVAVLLFAFNCSTNIVHCAEANTVKEAQDQIKRLRFLEKTETSKLYTNQRKLENAQNNLANTKKEYYSAENKLGDLEQFLKRTTAEYDAATALLTKRIRKVYQNQRVGMFKLLLETKDLNEFLDMINFQKRILKNDYDVMIAVKEKSERIAKMKKDVDSYRKQLTSSMNYINNQQANIKKAITKNQNMIYKYQNDRATYERLEKELAKQSDSIQTMINKTETSTVSNAGSGFMRPISGRISSPFGWRTHPIFNSRTFHSGVYIAGPNLGGIKAANAGKVIYSGWYGGYGKVVIIDHGKINGKPTTTLYAHMSSIKAPLNAYVQKGDVVGYEGTTGYSTGPHLHFEVRVNGKPTNPLNYI